MVGLSNQVSHQESRLVLLSLLFGESYGVSGIDFFISTTSQVDCYHFLLLGHLAISEINEKSSQRKGNDIKKIPQVLQFQFFPKN